MVRSATETPDGIENTSTTIPQVDHHDPEKGNDLKDPDGAGAPELAEVQELRYASSQHTGCRDHH